MRCAGLARFQPAASSRARQSPRRSRAFPSMRGDSLRRWARSSQTCHRRQTRARQLADYWGGWWLEYRADWQGLACWAAGKTGPAAAVAMPAAAQARMRRAIEIRLMTTPYTLSGYSGGHSVGRVSLILCCRRFGACVSVSRLRARGAKSEKWGGCLFTR